MAQFFPPDIGGEELHVFNLANALAARGHDVAVATQRMAGAPDEEVLGNGVRVHRFPTAAMRMRGAYSTDRRHHPPLPDPLGVLELRRIVEQERPQVVHAHNWIVNSALALRHHSGPGSTFGLVLTLHDYSHACATKRLMRAGALCEGPRLAKCVRCASVHYGLIVGPVTTAATFAMRPWKDRAIDHVISVSRAVAHANGVTGEVTSSIVPNFVADSLLSPPVAAEAATLSGLPEEPFLLFVGDISRDKGALVLLRAYASLAGDRPPLVLVGKPTRDTPAELPGGVRMGLNWSHEDVMAAFRRCLIAVLPSTWPDPCPTTVVEAMASGCAIVSTATGGIADMIEDRRSGVLVPPGDAPALAAAIAQLVASPELRVRLAAGARERAAKFTASAVVDQLESIYRRVMPAATLAGRAARR